VRKFLRGLPRYALLVAGAFLTLYPFSLVLLTSLKTTRDYMRSSIALPAVPQFSNYLAVFRKSAILPGFANSFIITSVVLVLEVLIGALAAYALTRMEFKKAGRYQLLFLAPMILPIQLVAIPIYLIYVNVGLTDTKVGIIVTYIATGLPLVIFMLTSFMKTIPIQISESAMIEGATDLQIFGKIMLPLLKPNIAAISVISGLGIWNDFFMPLLLLLSARKKTLPLKIYDYMGQYNSNWPFVSTCIVYVLVPILIFYVAMQKYIIKGVVAGAVKG
jgi:raffinose/stachyose/melibiose transport system permease protein